MVWLSDHDLAQLEAALLAARNDLLRSQHQDLPVWVELAGRLKAWRAIGKAEAMLAAVPSYHHPVAGNSLMASRMALESGKGRSLDVCREAVRHERVMCRISGEKVPGSFADRVNHALEAVATAIDAVAELETVS